MPIKAIQSLEYIKAGCNDEQKGFYQDKFKDVEKALEILDSIASIIEGYETFEKILDNWKVGTDNFDSDEKRQLLLDIEEVLKKIKDWLEQ